MLLKKMSKLMRITTPTVGCFYVSYVVMVVLSDWASAAQFRENLAARKESTDGEENQIDVFSFCKVLQMNLSAAITSSREETCKRTATVLI